METMTGNVDKLLLALIADGGTFDAKIYEGTPQNYLNVKKIWDCFIQLDNADRNWDDRSQIVTLTGTLFGHYFGEQETGNSKDYRGGAPSRAIGNGGPTPSSGYKVPADNTVSVPHQYIGS